MSVQATDPLKAFRLRQQHLIELIRRQRAVVVALEDTMLTEAMTTLEARVASDAFKVLVLGEFKNGKSTLINAMLSQKVLPAYSRPCTAVVNEVKYGERRHAILHPRDGGDPFEVPVDRLAEYVVISEDEPDRENPYRLAEVYWPLELCKDGVEIVDSPGLNDDAIREEVTTGYLAQADAIVFVLSAIAPLGETERRFLENFVLPLGHEDVFFVYNRINQVHEDERPELIASATQRLSRIGAGSEGSEGLVVRDDRLFFVNAKGALDGRLAQAQAPVEESRLPRFEAALQVFLSREKGRVKLMTPARELRQRLLRSRELIRDREAMYNQALQDLIDRYESERPKLEMLEQRRKVIVSGLDNDIRAIEAAVEEAARAFLTSLVPRCPDWAQATQTDAKITWSPVGTQKQAEAIGKELAAALDDKIQAELRDWQAQTLGPLLDERLAIVQRQLEQDITDFVEQARDIRLTIAGGGGIQVDAGTGSATERVLAGAAGLFLMDAGLGFVGAKFGALSMLKAAGPQLAILIAGVLIGLTPAAIVLVLLGSSVVQSARRMTKLNEKVKRDVGKAIGDELERAIPDQARGFGRQVAAQLMVLSEQVEAGLREETETVREQVEATIRDKQAGEAEVARRRAELMSLMAEVDAVDQERGDLVDEIAAG